VRREKSTATGRSISGCTRKIQKMGTGNFFKIGHIKSINLLPKMIPISGHLSDVPNLDR
jgi:hypothetical protein